MTVTSLNPTITAQASLPAGTADKLDIFLKNRQLGGFRAVSDAAACLVPLLKALGWRGDLGYLVGALPHFADELDVEEFRAVLANLNYASRPMRTRLTLLPDGLLPCLFVPDRGPAMVI